ncbi:amidohydrolase family protein [Mucilaginibacter sp. KACC 22063]|uniref:amidohydrolase family protein n=1 Tax=Mucilaginibacter sp. KACC 22063 TaxID=3025666 RepID=UPI0023673109|nr:amidohydrolase family protein [Mucilaginibacter sp. KACC 22063]WDF55929.1 amidohydrolase family protein [Mucilaginibacter sp. KACC 22063]
MKSYRADYVFTINADPIKNGVVTIDDTGQIIAVSNQPPHADAPVEQLTGILCPGFINTHCHVELSHLIDKIPVGCGLIEFIQNIQSLRNSDPEDIADAALKADAEMYENGIVAVADIVNSHITADLKSKSKVYYHSFVEAFSFLPERAGDVFENALNLLKQFKPQPCSVVPHAPYSVSKELFRLIRDYSDRGDNLLSIHNQECEDENKFYRYKTGRFLDLYEGFGIDITYFKPHARNSLQSIVPLLSNKQRILFVHNTFTNLKDIYFIKRFDRDIYWCFCPNANMYIEGRLPKVDLFIEQGYDITLGTDSLASNHKLCILSEMKTLQQHFPSIGIDKLLEWGTINGARYLGIDDEKGSLEVGKKPGLNLITNLDGLKLTPESKVVRLA